MGQQFVLASASPRRRQLLEQIGIEAKIVPSSIEERAEGLGPEEMVMELSRQKAEDVAAKIGEDAAVIGADTVVAIKGRILGKPSDPQGAAEMLSLLQGEVHQVYTGVTIVPPGPDRGRVTFFEQTDVSVYPMTEAEILAYVESGEPMDKAGAYGIQGRFAAHIRGIRGDYNNVVGLPVGRLYQDLTAMGLYEEGKG